MAARTLFFRYSSDVRPVAWVLLAATLSVSPFVVAPLLAARFEQPAVVGALTFIWFASLWARCRGPYSQHNHAHLAVFGSKPLNTAYDTVLTLITGYPTTLWELHHKHRSSPQFPHARRRRRQHRRRKDAAALHAAGLHGPRQPDDPPRLAAYRARGGRSGPPEAPAEALVRARGAGRSCSARSSSGTRT